MIFALLFSFIAAHAAPSPCLVYLSKRIERCTLELTATRDGFTIGKMLCSHNGGEAYVNAVYVEPDERRSGVMTELLAHMVEREEGTHSIAATLVLDNYRATKLVELGRDATEAECAEHVKDSPLYKAAAKLGFTKITQCVHSIRADMATVVFSL